MPVRLIAAARRAARVATNARARTHLLRSGRAPSLIVRWGWPATTLALAAALLATAWMARRRADDAEATLNRGQAEVLLQAARGAVRAAPPSGVTAALDSLLARQEGVGLRFVALLDPTGRVLARVGAPVGGALPSPAARPIHPAALVRAGSRLRLVGFAPPVDAVARRRTGMPHLRPSLLVLEFEPLVARRLAAQATDTLALSALVAAALLAAALLFWHLMLRQAQAERRLAEQRRLGALGEMSAVLAHEIRNPLASLKGHAQLLAERLKEASPDRLKAERVVKEAQRLEALTSDLLDFARSGPIAVRPVNPVDLVRSCVTEVGAGDFTLRCDGAPSSWRLDPDRMRQALTNILRNARQASPERKRPEVTVGRHEAALAFVVRDFGTGVPPGDEKRIFSPFYTTRTTGTGLGLAVAMRVAEMHGGTIVAANHPEGGAVFRLLIPAE